MALTPISLRGYPRAWLRGDLVVGATMSAVLIPESLADPTIAGVAPVVGLHAGTVDAAVRHREPRHE